MVHAAVQGPSDRRWRGIQKRWTPCTRNLLRGALQTAPVLLTSKDHVSICMSFIHSPKTHTSLWGSCHVVGTVSSTRDTLVNETLSKSSRNSLVMEGMGTNHIMTFVVQLLSHVWLFWDPWSCSPPTSSVPGIFQARILEWVAISFSYYDIILTIRWHYFKLCNTESYQRPWEFKGVGENLGDGVKISFCTSVSVNIFPIQVCA